MNVIPFTQQQADDYRTFMQQAARRFIEKHAAEHLDDDGLFERTVSYLVNSLDVPAFMAGRLALLAMSERLPKGLAWVAFDMAAGPDQSVRMVLDRRTGQFTPLPSRFLPHRFLAAPAAH
ncbi:TPA: hypothetical protein NH848_000840 [Pseudomonas aeruginosa]|uniref:hypothetical protein n=1 Tax=Pseudomonas aeruginosa TaxID=287 RepID=UPI002DD7822D|nr:hypothetical protein [Pseudomonas aeruginosa]HBN8067181.1 hypothetical protein [Pseudomonas aeruginosa]HBN8081506.1 hypothetical protein [Pseudomonas aeruginosa]HBN8177819.1 hypothetical protein [Pseudomonas aeruginosa]HBN8685662.1 hypothetical protein [Pseudomonas aeruginosa]